MVYGMPVIVVPHSLQSCNPVKTALQFGIKCDELASKFC